MGRVYHVPPQDPRRDPRQDQQNVPKKQTSGKMIAKIAIGAICIIVGLDDIFTDFTFFLFCLVIGLAFIAWGLVPYLEEKRREKAEETEKILNSHVPGLDEEDEAERLAKKYSNK